MHEIDARALVELLCSRVALCIPEHTVPCTDETVSTLHGLGAGLFERRDSWRAFEAGHGAYGGVETTRLSGAEVLLALCGWAPEQVKPRAPDAASPQHVALGSLLPAVQARELALTRWYDPITPGRLGAELVFAHDEGLVHAEIEGARVRRVRRFDACAGLDALGFERSQTRPTREVVALCEAAVERLARVEELLVALRVDHALAIKAPMAVYHAANEAGGYLTFYADGADVKTIRSNEPDFANMLDLLLADQPTTEPRPAPAGLLARARERELRQGAEASLPAAGLRR